MVEIKLKRIYETYDVSDGIRILIDRLWPRGMKKEDAKIDYWFKNIAPSNELRKWFHHQPDLFGEFCQKYKVELETDIEKSLLIGEICQLAKKRNITLLYAAKDQQHNHAIVLIKVLMRTI